MPPTCDRGRDVDDGDGVVGSDDVDGGDKADLTLVFCRILQLHR